MSLSRPYVIREGGASEIDQCARLANLAAPERDLSQWRGALQRDVELDSHWLVVAEIDDAVIAYGRAAFFEPAAEAPEDTAPRGYYLSGVFVRRANRRGGIASALTQARLVWISKRAEDAWFFANARNTASIELHRKFGFEEVTRRFSFPGATFAGGEGILFRLDLHRRGLEAPTQ
jgi:ribosomal protein S18 acetylase RimI-like enzyme